MAGQFDVIIKKALKDHPDLSDVLLVAGKPVQACVHGQLGSVDFGDKLKLVTPAMTRAFADELVQMGSVFAADLKRYGSCDLSYGLPGKARFRVNVYRQHGRLALALRRLPVTIPTMEELRLPDAFVDIARERAGLVLVAGATGSGKSHSLAAVLDMINADQPVHIVTLEDPIEFVHDHREAVVSQRELYVDFEDFASGLRAALRQAPKVIMVGEIRDRETVEVALQAAETGHLVLSTIHSADAGSAVNRVLGLFGSGDERMVRMSLAENLKYVVSQRLLPKEGGGRVPAFEVLRSNLRVRELVLSGETSERTFYRIIDEGSAHGMFTFDQHLLDLFCEGVVSESTAVMACSDKSRFSRMLDRVKTERGESTTDIRLDGLEADEGL